jgi:hypothetical protein
MIRNISIAHIASTKVSEANSAAAMMWQPMKLDKNINESWNLDSMTFGAGKVILRDSAGELIGQSDDFEIKGIIEMDRLCQTHLDEYDRVCADYLRAIQTRLPTTVGDERYFEFKVPSSSP